jgi:hypothetical protein
MHSARLDRASPTNNDGGAFAKTLSTICFKNSIQAELLLPLSVNITSLGIGFQFAHQKWMALSSEYAAS